MSGSPDPTMWIDAVEDGYRARIDELAAERDRRSARSARLGRIRTAAFLAALGLGLGAELTGGSTRLFLGAAALAALAGFLLTVRRHRRVREAIRRHEEELRFERSGLARFHRAWEEIPDGAPGEDAARTGVHRPAGGPYGGEAGDRGAATTSDHPYAADLDVLGPASLFRLLGTVSTAPGARTLRRWLLAPTEPGEALARQRAVEALAPRREWRRELAVRARLSGLGTGDGVERFVAWSEGDPFLEGRPWLPWAARLLPPTTVGLAAAQLAGAVAAPWWILGIAAALLITTFQSPAIHRIFERVSLRADTFGRYGEVLDHLSSLEGGARRLERLRRTVGSGPDSAAARLRALERLVAAADVRYNGMVHFPLQVLFLWDIHVLRRLERWRASDGERLRAWLEAVGQAEALSALATLRADHPDWRFPEFTGEPRFEAEALGHPLLPPRECVRNDVRLGPPGTFLFVTGSNMSGKSTLLRAIGLGAVLGLAGGPVPARRLRMPALEVRTAMRLEDSLAAGVSHFLAEVRRVAGIVRAAGARGSDRPRPLLYLLDEPLQGTNEAERRAGVRLVLRRLLDAPAIGAVATHDLRLDRTPELEDGARRVHFRGTVHREEGGPRLEFDYRLRSGTATTTNALELLEIGLEDGDPSGPAPAPPG